MIEYFEDEAGQFRFRIKGRNGEIVATSEGYDHEGDARRGARDLARIIVSIESLHL